MKGKSGTRVDKHNRGAHGPGRAERKGRNAHLRGPSGPGPERGCAVRLLSDRDQRPGEGPQGTGLGVPRAACSCDETGAVHPRARQHEQPGLGAGGLGGWGVREPGDQGAGGLGGWGAGGPGSQGTREPGDWGTGGPGSRQPALCWALTIALCCTSGSRREGSPPPWGPGWGCAACW